MSNTSLLGSYGGLGNSGLQFRNRIINGDMRIDQRNAGSSASPADETYTLDRWSVRKVGAGNFSVQQKTTQAGATNFESGSAPTGFTHSLKVTTTAQDSVMDASDVYAIVHAFEGLSVGDLGWGTSSARTITLSFWVKSSLAGVYGLGISNPLTDAGYSVLYTINSANTWEYKTIVIAGPTFGTFKTDNTAAFRVAWSLGCGSARSITPNSWVASNSFGATGQVNFMGQSTGATFHISGVQLEAGPVATPFEHRPYGLELSLCQRYYERISDFHINHEYPIYYSATNTFFIEFPLSQKMRPFKVSSNIADNQYTGSSAPTAGTQWTFMQSGNAYIAKSSGTWVFTSIQTTATPGRHNRLTVRVTGGAPSAVINAVVFGPSLYFEADAEL